MQNDIEFLSHIIQGFATLERISEVTYRYNPRELVYQREKVKLYHYRPKVKKPLSTPLLVVFATVNRPEILDLFPERSFIGGLLESGMDVYLVDWGYPDLGDTQTKLGDYVSDYLHHCVQHITQKTQHKKINLLGICQGGLMCVCYSTLFKNIKNLVLISAPIEFNTDDNVIGQFLKRIDVDALVGSMGNVTGMWLTEFFISLRPFELVGKKYLRFMDHLADKEWVDKFLQVEKWLYDAPDQTGASFTELVKDFYKDNKLIKGEIYIKNKKVDLANLTMPILNVMASEDEIVPVSASRGLKKYVSSKKYTQKIFPSGHIGIYISDKVGKRMPKAIAQWLKQHEKGD